MDKKLIFLSEKKYLNETVKGIEHKNQQTLKENRTIEHRQTIIKVYYTWAGILKHLKMTVTHLMAKSITRSNILNVKIKSEISKICFY